MIIISVEPYPSAPGGTNCCSPGRRFVSEQITNLTALCAPPMSDFPRSLILAAGAKTDGWSGYPGATISVTHDPHPRRQDGRPYRPASSCPGFTGSSPTSRSGPWASTTGCAASTSKCYLDEFVFRFNRPAHPACGIPVPPRHRRRPPAPVLQDVDLTGSKGIRLRRQMHWPVPGDGRAVAGVAPPIKARGEFPRVTVSSEEAGGSHPGE
jgi:hypothetical protein